MFNCGNGTCSTCSQYLSDDKYRSLDHPNRVYYFDKCWILGSVVAHPCVMFQFGSVSTKDPACNPASFGSCNPASCDTAPNRPHSTEHRPSTPYQPAYSLYSPNIQVSHTTCNDLPLSEWQLEVLNSSSNHSPQRALTNRTGCQFLATSNFQPCCCIDLSCFVPEGEHCIIATLLPLNSLLPQYKMQSEHCLVIQHFDIDWFVGISVWWPPATNRT